MEGGDEGDQGGGGECQGVGPEGEFIPPLSSCHTHLLCIS